MKQPHIVAIGGTLRPQSSTASALSYALSLAEAAGARTTLLTGPAIDFPNFDPDTALDRPEIAAFLTVIRSADAILIGSPGYHGTLSGLVKNALDHVELLHGDDRVYFDGMPVGLIATAGGWQAAVSTLHALRSIVHALRGWPTPMGVAINVGGGGDVLTPAQPGIAIMMTQIMEFLRHRMASLAAD